jgi:hypothetical protein
LIGGFSVVNDFTKGGPFGHLYLMQNRSIPANAPALYVVDTNGTTLANSQDLWRTLIGDGSAPDVLSNLQSIGISPNGKFLAFSMQGAFEGFKTYIIPLDANGIPDLANRAFLTSGAVIQGRGTDFDLAGNLYTISSGDAVVRSFSPGGFTIATSGSDGTFDLFTPSTQVSVSAATPAASEAGPTAGVFTLTRVSNQTSTPLTVSYTLTGTASNGVDYVSLPGSVTFAANETSTNITVTPIDDSTAELTEFVTLSLVGTINYSVSPPVSATISITDNETPAVDVSASFPSAFEQTTNDYVVFQLTRRGDTNAASFTVNLNYSGTAGSNIDYVALPSVNIDPGMVTVPVTNYTIDDAILEGNETYSITVASGSGYNVGTNSPSATGTIVDDEGPAETVLFSENFDSADSSTNWNVFFAAETNQAPDFTVTFGYDYSIAQGLLPAIPSAPHSAGDTHGVFMTVNKDGDPAAAALNLYPIGKSFSGNFALRFDMYLVQNTTAGQTEYALFGIDHSGNLTNWFRSSGAGNPGYAFDGLWFELETDGAALGDYTLNSSPAVTNGGIVGPTSLASRTATTLSNEFKVPPWVKIGAPANLVGSATPSWAQVEMSQIGKLITLKINNYTILTYTNATSYTNGNVMLGYCDAFDSIGNLSAGTGEGSVIYDNVRVIRLGIQITSIKIVGANTQIDFTWSEDEPTSVFRLQTASVVTGPYTNSGTAVITKLSPGVYRATVPTSGAAQFYRVGR